MELHHRYWGKHLFDDKMITNKNSFFLAFRKKKTYHRYHSHPNLIWVRRNNQSGTIPSGRGMLLVLQGG
jgi:hypothetical protein